MKSYFNIILYNVFNPKLSIKKALLEGELCGKTDDAFYIFFPRR